MEKKKKNVSKAAKAGIVIGSVAAAVAVGAAGIMIYKVKFIGNAQASNPFSDMGGMNMSGMDISQMVAAYGVTNIGMVNEAFPIEDVTTGLEVEEVLITSGQNITEETAVVKFTEDSVAEMKEELEEALHTAGLEYRSGRIEYEQAKINALYEYEKTVLAGESAQAVYEETIANMEANVEKAKEAYEEAKADIAEYEAAAAANTYQTNLENCQKEYDENYAALVEYMDEWDIAWEEVTGMGGGGDALRRERINVLKGIYSILESDMAELEEAEQELAEYSLNLQTLKLLLPELEAAYASAQADYESSLIQAKLTRETSVTEAELAEKNYETNLEKAEADFEALEEAKETAEENLEIFNRQIVDGYYYPTQVGTVLRVSARKNRDITAGSMLFMLQNAEEMTVTVSVDQADIAKLKIGGTAMVVSEEGSTGQGTITSINPVSSSDARSSITYSVIVSISGRSTGFSNNETVSVYFMEGGSNEKET